MKRDALSHPKMLDLASRLDVPRSQAIGILTLLFDFTAQYAPQGDIGKHRDGAIARACEWMTHADEFVDALVDAGWVDRSDKYRLRVHDWPEHCEQWVKLKLQKLKLEFLDEYRGQLPQGRSNFDGLATAEAIAEPIAEAIAEPTAELSASRDLAKPSLAKPSLAKPRGSGSASAEASPPLVTPKMLLDAWNATMGQSCELTDKRIKAIRLRVRDAKWCDRWEAAMQRCSASDFCRGVNDRGWAADFEWFIKPESVTRLMEGRYDNRQGKVAASAAPKPEVRQLQRHKIERSA